MSLHEYRNVLILSGGSGGERKISYQSCKEIAASLNRLNIQNRLYDIKTPQDLGLIVKNESFSHAFIGIHGSYGENGLIQTLLESLSIPYTGTKTGGSAMMWDKIATKQIASFHGIPVLPFQRVTGPDDYEEIQESLGPELCLKPIAAGSSNGISFCKTSDEFRLSFFRVTKEGTGIFAEPLCKAREISVSILLDQLLPLVEIKYSGEFYDYQAKYHDSSTQLVPLPGKDLIYSRISEFAERIYSVSKLRGFVRVDFFLKGEKIYLSEVNTIPGLTSHSIFPFAAKLAGISFDEMIKRILLASS